MCVIHTTIYWNWNEYLIFSHVFSLQRAFGILLLYYAKFDISAYFESSHVTHWVNVEMPSSSSCCLLVYLLQSVCPSVHVLDCVVRCLCVCSWPHFPMLFPTHSKRISMLVCVPPPSMFIHVLVFHACIFHAHVPPHSSHYTISLVSSLMFFHPYMSTSICLEAVSTMVWRRNEAGMGVWVGSNYKPGSVNCFSDVILLFFFIVFRLYIQYHICYEGHRHSNKIWNPYEYLFLAFHYFL